MLPSEPVPETLAPEPTPPEQDADDDVDPPEDPDDIPDDPIPAAEDTRAPQQPDRRPEDVLLDHAPSCPYKGVRHIKHDAVARLLRKFMREAGAPKRRAVLEARGLAGTSLRRPGDVTWFLYTDHAHLVVDCAVAGVYQKSMLRDGLWRRAGAAARMRERHKIRADARADHPVQHDHTFVPFVVEDGGRLGLQALDLLDRLARRAAQHSGDGDPQLAARIRTRWLQELSTMVHSRQAWFITDSITASRCPDAVALAESI